AEFIHDPNSVPIKINFIPRQPVPGGSRVRVMIVVPAFAPANQCNPPTVGRIVARRKPAGAPRMRRRIYQPGEMQANNGAQENAPEHEGKPAESEKRYSQRNNRNIMILRNPDVKLVLGQVGNVAGQSGRVVVHGLAHQNPAHMRPPLSISWGMRVAFLVRMLVVNSMCGHPENGAAFESKSR